MSTSFVLAALMGLAAGPVATADDTAWVTDYAAAYARGNQEHKPLALVFGSGKAGADALVKEGKFDTEVLDAVKAGFIPVYIDVDRDAGRKVAESFKVVGSPSLVLTDKEVDFIALRHVGAMDKTELMQDLKKFADPTRVVEATQSNFTSEVRYYSPTTSAPVMTSALPASSPTFLPAVGAAYVPAYTPAYAPAYQPNYAPSFAPAFGPAFGGSCPGGRCGNR